MPARDAATDLIVGERESLAAVETDRRLEDLRQSEVQHLDRAVGLELHVRRLQVAMDDAVFWAASIASAICAAIDIASSRGSAPALYALGQRWSTSTSSITITGGADALSVSLPRGRRWRQCSDGSATRGPGLRVRSGRCAQDRSRTRLAGL